MTKLFERVLWGCGAVAVFLVGGLLLANAEASGSGVIGIRIGTLFVVGFCVRQVFRAR